MKKRYLVTSLLAVALGFGIAAGLSLAKNNSQVQSVKATSAFSEAAVYLETNSNWEQAGARFAVYWSTGSEEGWNSMANVASSFYCTKLPEKEITLIIFCRMNGANTTNSWSNKWNQTADITSYSSSSAVYKMTSGSWDAGSWQSNSGYTSKFTSKYIAGTDNNWTTNDNNYKLALDMTKAEARLVKNFNASEFKITNGAWGDGEVGCSHVSSSVNSTYVDISAGGNSNITLKVAGEYEIYWKYHDMDGKEIWIQISSSTEADLYAQEFLSTIKCNSSGINFTLDKWNTVGSATTSMEYKYGQLTSGARHLLTSASASESGSNVQQCVARYDRILSKYGYGTGDDDYHDFMGRTPAPLSSSRMSAFNNSSEIGSNNAIAIVLASTAGIAAVGGYFVLRKKKIK